MQVLIAMIMVSLLAMVAPAEAQASGKWIKGLHSRSPRRNWSACRPAESSLYSEA